MNPDFSIPAGELPTGNVLIFARSEMRGALARFKAVSTRNPDGSIWVDQIQAIDDEVMDDLARLPDTTWQISYYPPEPGQRMTSQHIHLPDDLRLQMENAESQEQFDLRKRLHGPTNVVWDSMARRHHWYCELVLLSKASEILGRTVDRPEELKDRIRIEITPDGTKHTYLWVDGRKLLAHASVPRFYDRDQRRLATFDYEVSF